MLRLMRECLSTNSALGARLAQTRLLHRFWGSRLGEVLLLRCRGVLLANISPLQICKRPMSANIDKKTFSGNAVKVVGAFASNAPLRATVGGAHRRGAPLLRIARGCLSANYF